MTLINALEELKSKGITKLSGLYGLDGAISDIDKYIENARECHDSDIRWADIPCHKHSLKHEDDHFIVKTLDGHFIIATHYDGFNMVTYSNYKTEEKAEAAFDEWEIAQQAIKIADQKVKHDNSLSREAWVLIATEELRKAYKQADESFERKFGEKEKSV